MKKIFEKMREESGQALVIVAVGLVALLGVTAFSVDLGMAYNAKAELQAAADATALAAAQDLSYPSKISNTVLTYAASNGVDNTNVTYKTPYVDETGATHNDQIEVTCTRTFHYLFARVLGFDSKIIQARAVAERRLLWGKQTLPFLNIDDRYDTGEPIVLWEKTGYGDFEHLYGNKNNTEYEFTYTEGNKPTAINCMLVGLDDGFIDITQGVKANIGTEVNDLCNLWSPGEFIYVLSLKDIPADPVNYTPSNQHKEGGKTVSASISLDDIVLVKCKIVSYKVESKDTNANDRGIVLQPLAGFTPINLGTVVREKTPIDGFVNTDFKVRLIK